MSYKVFLVEDEIVTREGIRDNVHWEASGFQFCGEAPDGEIALSLLEAARPDVLITDIRMPFMDGLQLSKIVRERMPGVKVVILSGHDEFEYAQAAIKLGVTEYLLKPVSVQDMHGVLRRLAAQIEREQKEQADLQRLQAQIEEGRAALRESLFLKLVMGTISAAEAIEQGQALGIDLVARWYLVALVRVRRDGGPQPSREQCRHMEQIVAAVADTFVCIADQSKRVEVLGRFPLPVEVIPMALRHVLRQLAAIGGTPVLREGFVTDNGNLIVDVAGLEIVDAVGLETRINQIVGVVTNGLFASRPADVCLLGTAAGVQTLTAA